MGWCKNKSFWQIFTCKDGDEVICLDEGADVEEVIVIQDGDDVVCIDGGVEVPVVDADPTLPSGGGGGVGHAVTGGGFNFDPWVL